MKRLDVAGTLFVPIWVSGYVVGSIAAKAAPPLAVTFWRIAIAAALLAGLGALRGARWPRDVATYAWLGAIGALLLGVQFGGIYLGLSSGMPAGTSALIASCCPLIVAVSQALLGWERLTVRQWTGAALGMSGVVLSLLDRISQPKSIEPVLWTLAGLAGFATATVLLQRRQPRHVDGLLVASIECVGASAILAPWALLHGGLAIPFTARAMGATTWLTVVNAVGGPLTYFFLIRSRGATRTSSLLFLVPAATAIASWPILGQRLGATAVAGLIVAGAGVTLMRPRAGQSVGGSPNAGNTDGSNVVISTSLPSSTRSTSSDKARHTASPQARM
jgi:drug/metabolite transporter (DMT)-like permease